MSGLWIQQSHWTVGIASCTIPGMQSDDFSPVHLQRVDPAHNMRRFYAAGIQPTLFGGASVIRYWGRIGTTGRSMVETFDQNEEAHSAFVRLVDSKRRRGYTRSSSCT